MSLLFYMITNILQAPYLAKSTVVFLGGSCFSFPQIAYPFPLLILQLKFVKQAIVNQSFGLTFRFGLPVSRGLYHLVGGSQDLPSLVSNPDFYTGVLQTWRVIPPSTKVTSISTSLSAGGWAHSLPALLRCVKSGGSH